MTKNEYNGWTNYETWCVNLWIDNVQGSQEYWLDLAAQAVKRHGEEMAAYEFAEQIKSEHEDSLPELVGFAADLLNAAMSEVNWQEVARGLINKAKEQAA
jgi:hypothetical protein